MIERNQELDSLFYDLLYAYTAANNRGDYEASVRISRALAAFMADLSVKEVFTDEALESKADSYYVTIYNSVVGLSANA